MQDRAYFVHQPRRIEDLYGPRPLEAYTPYRVIGTVELSQMAYENFITDLLAERDRRSGTACWCVSGEAPAACWWSPTAPL